MAEINGMIQNIGRRRHKILKSNQSRTTIHKGNGSVTSVELIRYGVCTTAANARGACTEWIIIVLGQTTALGTSLSSHSFSSCYMLSASALSRAGWCELFQSSVTWATSPTFNLLGEQCLITISWSTLLALIMFPTTSSSASWTCVMTAPFSTLLTHSSML